MILGQDIGLFSLIFDACIVVISVVLAFFIAKWARAKMKKSRIATTFGNLDPKTGLCQMQEIPPYNERPAAIRWEDTRGKINRRNTTGHPTLQLDFSTSHGGGIERIYVCASNSRTCQTTEAICGEAQTDDLSTIADRTISLWDEQSTELEIQPPTFKQVWWQLALGIFAGVAIGVIVLAVVASRQTPPQNATQTAQAAMMMVRTVVGA